MMSPPTQRRALVQASLATALLLSYPVAASERIVSIGPGTSELLVALGAESQIVASDVSSAQLKGAKVGYQRTLAAEGILSLSPTRIIGSDEMGPPATLDQLRRAGVQVDTLPTAATIDNLLQRIDLLAGVLGAQSKAEALKKDIASEQQQLQQLASQHAPRKIAFLLIHKGQPLSIGGGDTTAGAIISLLGGINTGAALKGYKPVSAEALIQMQPDLVLVSGREWQRYQDKAAVLADVPAIAATPAGKQGAIEVIDGRTLQGGLSLGTLKQALQLAHALK
ncbi:MAG: heme/hemin ABC transporter substrate-binding protein [Aeromonas sp.]